MSHDDAPPFASELAEHASSPSVVLPNGATRASKLLVYNGDEPPFAPELVVDVPPHREQLR